MQVLKLLLPTSAIVPTYIKLILSNVVVQSVLGTGFNQSSPDAFFEFENVLMTEPSFNEFSASRNTNYQQNKRKHQYITHDIVPSKSVQKYVVDEIRTEFGSKYVPIFGWCTGEEEEVVLNFFVDKSRSHELTKISETHGWMNNEFHLRRIYGWGKSWVLFSDPGIQNDNLFDCEAKTWSHLRDFVPFGAAVSVTSGGQLLIAGGEEHLQEVMLYNFPSEEGVLLPSLMHGRIKAAHGLITMDGKDYMIVAGGGYIDTVYTNLAISCEYLILNESNEWQDCQADLPYGAMSDSSVVWKNTIVTILYDYVSYKIYYGIPEGPEWLPMGGDVELYIDINSILYLKDNMLCIAGWYDERSDVEEFCRKEIDREWTASNKKYKKDVLGSLKLDEVYHCFP